MASGSAKKSPDGRTAAEQLGAIRARVHGLVLDHARLVAEVRAALATEGVAVVDHAAVPEHHARLRERYLEEIFPVLTPLAVAPGHPFPYISTLSLSLAVVVRDPDGGEPDSPASRCRRSCHAWSPWTPTSTSRWSR